MTLHTNTIHFSLGYVAWLALLTVAALECVRRFRYPISFFVLGLTALGLTFWFVMTSVSWWHMGQEVYQFQITYHYFRVVGFLVFLVFFLARGGYLLFHARKRENAT